MDRGETAEQPIGEIAAKVKRKAAFLRNRPYVDQKEAYHLFKQFFQAFLRKQYEFTMDELRHEVHRIYLSLEVRRRVEKLIDDLAVLEYSDMQYSQEQVKQLLHEVEAVVEALSNDKPVRIPTLTRLVNRLLRREQEIEPKGDQLTADMDRLLGDLYLALEQGRPHEAKRHYEELKHRYDHLGEKAQTEFYDRIFEAYETLKKHKAS